MSKHTPGPWTVSYSKDPWIGEVLGPSLSIAGFLGASKMTDEQTERRQADLHLIAAAPEMLEALKNALDFIQCADVPEEDVFELHESARIVRAAIVKAKGEQP